MPNRDEKNPKPSEQAQRKGADPFRNKAGNGARGPNEPINPRGPTTGTEGWGLRPDEETPTRAAEGTIASTRKHEEVRRADDRGDESGRTFRCADMGNADCRWEVTGRTEDELLPQIERHARDEHGMRSLDERARRKVIGVIRERRAA